MDDESSKSRFRFKSIYFVYILLFAMGVYFVIYHGPHLWNILPLLIILLCPLMHMMHHGQHGKHGDSRSEHKHDEKMDMRKDKESKDNNKHKGCH